MNENKTYDFKVKRCPEKHAGQGRVLINYKRRDNAKRFQIVRLLTPSGSKAYAAVVGHYGNPEIIMMDHDLRVVLNLKDGDETALEVHRCGYFGIIYWYLTVPDPLVRVPAVLALISLLLGVAGVIFALMALP